jgi:hypothetical protein
VRILCNFTPCGPAYVRSGWGRVFQALGHDFRFWDPGQKPAFDIFSEFEPDLYLGTTYETDRAVAKCIAKRPHMKVALYASAWGPYLKDVDLQKYPLVVASEQEKRALAELKKTTGKPDFVFIHAHDRWLDGTMSGWKEIGVDYHGVLNAADTFVYMNGRHRPELECDIGFVGGYWGYKARNIDRYLLPLLHPSSGLRSKVFGNQPWPVHQYLGTCSDEDARDLFVSAAVCPNISEPHSTDCGWDVIERPFKVAAAGGFCVSDYVEEGRDLFTENELPMADNPKRFEELIRYFVEKPGSRDYYQGNMRQKVLAEHTYFDRVADIFSYLGMKKERMQTLLLKASTLPNETPVS